MMESAQNPNQVDGSVVTIRPKPKSSSIDAGKLILNDLFQHKIHHFIQFHVRCQVNGFFKAYMLLIEHSVLTLKYEVKYELVYINHTCMLTFVPTGIISSSFLGLAFA